MPMIPKPSEDLLMKWTDEIAKKQLESNVAAIKQSSHEGNTSKHQNDKNTTFAFGAGPFAVDSKILDQ